jgi:hypothetical protein
MDKINPKKPNNISKSFFLFVIFLSLINKTFEMNFKMNLEPRGMLKCFGEYFIENKAAKVFLKSKSKDYSVRVIDPNGNTIFGKERNEEVKISLIAQMTGTYQFCFLNMSQEIIPLHFTLFAGIAAKDYSSLTKVSAIQPLELALVKLLDSIEFLIREFGIVFSNEIHDKTSSHESISSSIFYFSFITFVIIVFVNSLEFLLLKNFVSYRKEI